MVMAVLICGIRLILWIANAGSFSGDVQTARPIMNLWESATGRPILFPIGHQSLMCSECFRQHGVH
jgi:hypothetical protein